MSVFWQWPVAMPERENDELHISFKNFSRQQLTVLLKIDWPTQLTRPYLIPRVENSKGKEASSYLVPERKELRRFDQQYSWLLCTPVCFFRRTLGSEYKDCLSFLPLAKEYVCVGDREWEGQRGSIFYGKCW